MGGLEPAGRHSSEAPPSPRPAPLGENRRRATSLIAAASVELSPRDGLAGAAPRALLPPGLTVFVNHPPRATHHDLVAACVRLRRDGFQPVPHIAARRLVSFTQFDDFLRRVTGEAGIDRALLIAGDPDRPLGPFRDTLDLLASGAIERHGLAHIWFGVYPERHPRIDARTLAAALDKKLDLARRSGSAVSLVTQFCFAAAPIMACIRALRANAVDRPIEIGIAGPGTVANLAKFAIRCGVGASLEALARGQTAFARILTRASPDALIDALVAAETPELRIDALHLFTFAGLRHTAEWRRRRLEAGPS